MNYHWPFGTGFAFAIHMSTGRHGATIAENEMNFAASLKESVMSEAARCLGVVTKVIRVPLIAEGPTRTQPKGEAEGYGLLRDEDGQEIFFTHSAIEGCPFTDLQSGQTVAYELEKGPLKRAIHVRPVG